MARSSATIEYLIRLIEWSGGKGPFCARTTITPSNLSDYLRGAKPISWKRLHSATSQVFGVPPAFEPVIEGYDLEVEGLPDLSTLPKDPGIYGLFDSAMRVLYYGKATSLYAEVRQTLKRRVAEVRPWTGAKNLTLREITKYVSAYKIVRGDETFRHDIEVFGLRFLVNNTFNKNGGSFKRKS
jgi:hypothetical protein